MNAMTWYRKHFGTLAWAFICSVLLSAGLRAHGSVAILLEEPYGELGRVNPAGHSAVYLDHVCAESPTVLRPCREGELGAVLSRYDGIGNYDWLAVPLLPYLYAVETSGEIPLTMNRELEAEMRNVYRRDHLQAIAADLPDGRAPDGNWYELVGASYDRTIYGFQVKSTPEQDARLIALFNDRRNVERYNGAFRNCADFTRVTINRFYPHAIRRNFIADFGITTPKSVARALTNYAKGHTEVELKVFKIPQVEGEIKRSHKPEGVAESLLKKYGAPLVVLSPVTATVVLVAYIGQGRFALPKEAAVLDLRAPAPTLANAEKTHAVEAQTKDPPVALGQAVPSMMQATSPAASEAAPSFLGDATSEAEDKGVPTDLLDVPLL